MISPAIWIVIPIDGVLNITVASMVIHWTKRKNMRLIPKMENRRCGFRSVYRLSIVAAVVATCFMVLRYFISTSFISYRSLPPGFYLLNSISWIASLFCILLLALISSASAPTTAYVSLTSSEGALISTRQQECDTREGKPMVYCLSLPLSRAICCVCCILPIIVLIISGTGWFGLFRSSSSISGYGYTCETAVFPTPSPDCDCLTSQQIDSKGLLCSGTANANCFTSTELLCPTRFFSSYSVNISNLQQVWLPTCIVDSGCNSNDYSAAKLGLRSRHCVVRDSTCQIQTVYVAAV